MTYKPCGESFAVDANQVLPQALGTLIGQFQTSLEEIGMNTNITPVRSGLSS